MRKKKIIIGKNYLDKIPVRSPSVKWKADGEGLVTLEIENTGWMNRIMQKVFFRPKISYIHLDKLGSFVWSRIDGEKSILCIGELVEESFSEESHPLYERLARYFQMLESYSFVDWAEL